jgi:hypothetical protein
VRASSKLEIRNSKSETNPKLKYQRLKTRPTSPARVAARRHASARVLDLRISDFEFISDFGFRVLDFALPLVAAVTPR